MHAGKIGVTVAVDVDAVDAVRAVAGFCNHVFAPSRPAQGVLPPRESVVTILACQDVDIRVAVDVHRVDVPDAVGVDGARLCRFKK